MKRFLIFFGLFGFITTPLWATDVDFYAGLEWQEPETTQKIRLLGIYPSILPEGLEDYRLLVPKTDPLTRHGDLLAHIIVGEHEWLQSSLVMSGRAIVMPVYETHTGRLLRLKNHETVARFEKLGLWADDPVVCAKDAGRAFDTFSIIQGRVIDAANVRGTVYLNFGEDFRNDFTIKITRKIFRTLPEDMQSELLRLTDGQGLGMLVEARGWVFYSGGPMIEPKTGAQLDILSGFNAFDKGCPS